MNNDINKREFVRVPDCSEIFYESASSGKKKKSETKDIGQQGICFIADEKLSIDSVIEVSLMLEQLEFSFTGKAVVRWINEIVKNRRYEIGVKFIDVTEIEAKKLINYIGSAKKLDRYT